MQSEILTLKSNLGIVKSSNEMYLTEVKNKLASFEEEIFKLMDINKKFALDKEDLKMMNSELLKKTTILEAKISHYELSKLYETKNYKHLYKPESEPNTERSGEFEYFNINNNAGNNPIQNLGMNHFMEKEDSVPKLALNDSKTLQNVSPGFVSPGFMKTNNNTTTVTANRDD